MKTLHTALLASSFLFVTYVAAPAPAHAGGWRCEQLAGHAEKNTNAAIDAALDAARRGLPIRSEVEALRTVVGVEEFTYVGMPDQCVIQMMIEHELAKLISRAELYMANQKDVHQMQLQIVLGRYERAVQKIKLAWKNGEIADDIAYQALAGLRIDAEAYLQSLGVVSIRELLQEAITELLARGMDAMDRVDALHDAFEKLYQLRLETALAVLNANIQDGKFTKFDYERVQKAVEGLETLQSAPQPNDCGS